MTRSQFLWCTVLTIVLGLVAGWFLMNWFVPPGVSPVQTGTPSTLTKPASRAGYCCTTIGGACDEVSDPGLCFRAGGRAFNAVQRNCDYYCYNVKL